MDQLRLQEWVADYLNHCRTGTPSLEPAAIAVTTMTFTWPSNDQWPVILEAIRQARDDFDLACIAIGPMQGLVGRHGEEVIDQMQDHAVPQSKFVRMLTGMDKYTIGNEVWERIESLRATVVEPLQVTSEQKGRIQDERIRLEEDLWRQIKDRLNEPDGS